MSLFSPLSISLLGVLCASAVAQSNSIEIRGQVEISQQSGCYYCPPITSYVIHGSETPIRSSVVSIAPFVGLDVLVTGTWSMVGTTAVVDVATIQTTTPILNIGGGAKLGSTIRWTAAGTPGDLAVHVLALGASFVPLVNEVFLLDPTTSVILAAGTIPTSGQFRFDLPIPNSPQLVGLHLFGQAAIAPASGTPLLVLSNPETKKVQ